MASCEHDVGGVGGKFRRRPFRRAPATPYDRPQTAIRSKNLNPDNPIGGNNGWISKIVDPASRIIARGASKFFSSVFQKRLTSSHLHPPPPEENLLSGHRAPEGVRNNLQTQEPSHKALEQGVDVGESLANLYDTDGTQKVTLPGTDGLSELERLLKLKTFTRAEFEHLTDLLHSRTVDPSTSKPAVDYENKEEAIVTEVQNNRQSIIEPSKVQPVVSCGRKEMITVSDQEGRMNSPSLHRNMTDSAVNLHIPKEEAVSPEKIAKEYMDSRPSKLSPPTLSLRGQILHEDATLPSEPYAKKPSAALLASRPSVPFSRIVDHSESSYMTPRPRGRSALYKMSRSPYFRVHQTTNIRGGRPLRDSLSSSSTSSSLVQSRFMLSTGKQVLKRGSSALDNDFGSFGTLRRNRQKSDFMSSPSERHSSPSGGLLPSLITPPDQEVNKKSASATQRTFTGVTHVPPQSTEMARKIFQELGKLVPSPREKLSKKKGNGNLDVAGDSPLPSPRNSISPKHDRIKDSNPSENAVSAAKATHEVVGMDNSVRSAISDSASIPSQKKLAFQETMAEESLELGAYKYSTDSVPELSSTGKDKLFGKSLVYPLKSIPASSSTLKGEANVKASDRPATEKGDDFMLSPTAASSSQLSPTPEIPHSLADKSVTKKEISVPASKSASEGLSTITVTSGPASLTVGTSATPPAGFVESLGSDREGQSNGSLPSFSSFPICAGSAAAFFGDFSTEANFSSPSVSVAQPTFASTLSFQFGSASSTGASISVPLFGDKSGAGDSDRKSVKTSPFSISSSISSGSPNAFSNANMTGSVQTTSSIFSSTAGSSNAPATSSFVLSTASGSSLLTTSSAFSSPVNGIFGFAASAQHSSPSSSFAKSNFSSGSSFGETVGSTFGAQPTLSVSGKTSFPDSSAVQHGTFGFNASSSLNSATSPFGDATSMGKIFGSHTGVSSATAGSSSSSSIVSFGLTSSTNLFSSSTQPSLFPMLASTLGSNPSSLSSGFSFGLPASSSGSFTSPVDSSSGPVFSFSSVRTTTSSTSPSPAQPVSGMLMQGAGFGLSSPGDDRMNVEDAMVDDNIQPDATSVPAFGQPANSLSAPNLQFGTPAAPSGGSSVFQFGSNHNSTVAQSPSPFQSAGSFEFSAGGSFSLGSGGGDKSGRRIVRVKRDKHRKK